MAVRIASAFSHGAFDRNLTAVAALVVDSQNLVTTGSSSITFNPDPLGLYIAPSCYSEVRKVVFWANVCQEIQNLLITLTGNNLTDLFSTVSGSHGLVANDIVQFSTSVGSLPVNIFPSTNYYVIALGLTASSFRVSTTQGGGQVDFTTNGSLFFCVKQNLATPTARIRVAPSSSSSTTIAVTSASFPASTTDDPITHPYGGSRKWSNNAVTSTNCFYGYTTGNTATMIRKFEPQSVAFPGTHGSSQLIYAEFDRFDATASAFFNDWDSIAALQDDDRFVRYLVGVERFDGTAWTLSDTTATVGNAAPKIYHCGFAVIQAPSPSNKTRLFFPATPTYRQITQSSAQQADYRTTPNGSWVCERPMPFVYKASEWSGQTQIRLFMRRGTISGTAFAPLDISVRICEVQDDSTTLTPVYTESFTYSGTFNGTGTGTNCLYRTSDLTPYLQDGKTYIVQQRADTGTNTTPLMAHWEITSDGYNTVSVCIPAGTPPGAINLITSGRDSSATFESYPSTIIPRYSRCEPLFDPLWFQDFPNSRIISTRAQGAVNHRSGGNDILQYINLNPDLDLYADGSAFNSVMNPSLTSTPNATLGYKLLDLDINTNNPLNLAGKRKLSVVYQNTWNSITDDIPGPMSLVFVLNVPNTDILPLGPLFDVGSFDAEGCAATSAGLGEPALLVITNGSSIPQKFNPTAAGSSSEIENVGIQAPFEGEVPSTLPGDIGVSPAGGLGLGIYRYRYTFRNCCTGKESDPNVEDIVVDTSAQSPAAQVTFSFAGVRIPGDAQICEICLYRTLLNGVYPIMAKVGCFNPDSTSTFIDDLADTALDFTNDGLSLLNAPMPCVPIVVDYSNRLFGMGDIPNLAPAGTVSVINGSDIVTGDDDVLWDRCLEGRLIKIGGDCRAYEISKILPPVVGTSPAIARLKLSEPYEGTTDVSLTYEVCGRPNRLYFSEPLEPEYWPLANFLDIEPGDGDRLMGAASNFDRLIICKRRKTYILTFRENPALEVIVPTRISSDIGCIGSRTFAQVEVGTVWLSDRGLAIYDGRNITHVPASEKMNDIFIDPDNPNYVRRDRNGRVIEAVGKFYPRREQYLLLLPTVQTDRGCDMMLVWDVKLNNVTLLKFCQEFLSMEIAKDAEGNERVYLGDTNGFVWIYDVGDTDGVGYPNATGTVRGDITFAGIETATGASVLRDTSANFIAGGVPGIGNLSGISGLSGSWNNANMGIAGACVYTRRKDADYDEPWTVRTIYASTPTELYVTPPWGAEIPFDATGEYEFEYMIGAIELDLLFKPQNYGTDDMAKRDWRQIVVHEPESFASQLRIDLLPDFQMVDPEADTVVDPVTGETGEGRVFRMDYSRGRQIKPVGRNIHHFMGIRMRNFAPEEPVRIINHLLCTEPRSSR